MAEIGPGGRCILGIQKPWLLIGWDLLTLSLKLDCITEGKG